MKLKMFRATHRPSSGTLNCTSSLWFSYVEGCRTCSCWTLSSSVYATWQRPTTARPTTFHVCKTRGCWCSFRLLMIGGISPETFWALFKIRNNKTLIHRCILLGFPLYDGDILVIYYNAKLHSRAAQTSELYALTGGELQINETDAKQIT